MSQVELVEDTKGEAYQHGTIEIAKADGEKCARCWNYSESLGSVGELDDLCPRCQEVVKR